MNTNSNKIIPISSSLSSLQSSFNSIDQMDIYKSPLDFVNHFVDLAKSEQNYNNNIYPKNKSKFIQDQAKLCLNNTTKYQREQLKKLMEDVLIEQQKECKDQLCENENIFDTRKTQLIQEDLLSTLTLAIKDKQLENEQENQIRPLSSHFLTISECENNTTYDDVQPISNLAKLFEDKDQNISTNNSITNYNISSNNEDFSTSNFKLLAVLPPPINNDINDTEHVPQVLPIMKIPNQKQQVGIFKKNLTNTDANKVLEIENNSDKWIDINNSTSTSSSLLVTPNLNNQFQDKQRSFLTYFIRKNIKNVNLKNNIIKRLKQNDKLKNEILDLFETTELNFLKKNNANFYTNADDKIENCDSINFINSFFDKSKVNNDLIIENNDEKMVIKEQKLILNELSKKDNYLCENMNRNILTLEKFMDTNMKEVVSGQSELTGDKESILEKKGSQMSGNHSTSLEKRNLNVNEIETENGQLKTNKIKRFNFFSSKNHLSLDDLVKQKKSKNFDFESRFRFNRYQINDQTFTKNEQPNNIKANEPNNVLLIEKTSVEPDNYVRGKGRGKYLCVECGIRKVKLCELKQHLFAHANLRPFICYHCNLSFKTKGNLVKHVKTKAHLNRCIQIGMNADDEQVTQVTLDNVDTAILNRQMEIDKNVIISKT